MSSGAEVKKVTPITYGPYTLKVGCVNDPWGEGELKRQFCQIQC